MIYTAPTFTIYFGAAADKLYQADYLNLPPIPILEHPAFAHLKNHMPLQDLMFLRQVHGVAGLHAQRPLPRPFSIEGDYLLSRSPIGIGVMTADCLPIVIYDPKNHVAAIAHAGWRGSVAGIGAITLQAMAQAQGTRPENVQIFFGPSIKKCCYQVGADFSKNIAPSGLHATVMEQRDDGWYFDLPQFNALALIKAGVQPAAINGDYNLCTACDHQFFSYRRQGQASGRQMTVIACDQMTVIAPN